MDKRDVFVSMLNENIKQINLIVDHLYVANSSHVKNRLLDKLTKNISNISVLAQEFDLGNIVAQQNENTQGNEGTQGNESTQSNENTQSNESIQTPPENEMRVFTPAELLEYDGRNGKPAYVAVNGLVYDVTNVPAWAAVTHFGLEAGKDLSFAFNTCHIGQPQILDELKIVGTMAR